MKLFLIAVLYIKNEILAIYNLYNIIKSYLN